MGKTKIKSIDDAQAVQAAEKIRPKKKSQDELVEKLKEELGITAEESEAETKKKAEEERQETKKVAKSNTNFSKAKSRGKKYLQKVEGMEKSKAYPITDAVELAKKASYSSFNGTLEAHINATQQNIRGLVTLPHATGKKLRILAFGQNAEESGADLVGDEAYLDKISQGQIEFDLVVTTPEWMPKLAKIAKFLGPKGLMPNPKNGTITQDLKKAVESFQQGKTEYKSEPKFPLIHISLGKLNQPTPELTANAKALVQAIGKTKIRKITLSPTHGPSVKVDLASF